VDHRSLLSFTAILVLLLQLQAHLAASERQTLSASGWPDRQERHQLERRRLAADLAELARLR
jgi:hypothetical protein